MTQLGLLASRRFAPYFATQLFGTFNDNLFRNALIAAVVHRSVTLARLSTQTTVALSAALFIVPFFVLSPLAGQLAEKLSKSRLMRAIKLAELFVVVAAAVGFWLDVLPLLLTSLFMMGVQSTLFETVKYSVLPDLLGKRELIGGNGLVGASTFLAILAGTLAGGFFGDVRLDVIPAVALVAAFAGVLTSLGVPNTEAAQPDLRVALDPRPAIADVYRALVANRTVLLSAVGLSWLWFVGGSFLVLLPSFGTDVLAGSPDLVGLLLTVFCIGVAVGSLLASPLGGGRLELGLVPLGSIGMTLALLDLYFATTPLQADPNSLLGVEAFLATEGARRCLVDVFLVAAFGGLFSVPLYTLLQDRPPPTHRSRVVAGSNILNAFALTLSSSMLLALPHLGITIPQTFLLLAALSAAAFVYIYSVIPEFLLRLIAWLLAHILYRIRVEGRDNLPDEGAAIVVANHVTYVDWLVISSVYQRPLRFVMHQSFIGLPLVGWAFRDAKVIPIASRRENSEVLETAFARISAELEDDNVVCLFPEGQLTHDGELGELKPGILKTLKTHPVPVVPIRIDGLWGSFFSRKDDLALKKPFRRVWSRVSIHIYPPLAPDEVTLEALRERLSREPSSPETSSTK